MKTIRFNFCTAVFAVLMSVSLANAQVEQVVLAVGKFALNTYKKDKEVEKQMSYLESTYNAWAKELIEYHKKTGKVGDCQTINYKPLSNNKDTTDDFFYECGVRGGKAAYLEVRNRNKIWDCPGSSKFGIEFDLDKGGYPEAYSNPAIEACIFVKASPPPKSTPKKSETSKYYGNCSVVTPSDTFPVVYCGYTNPLGCYKIQNMYPDVETGVTCEQKQAKGCEPCQDKIDACMREGTVYKGVNPKKLNASPWGAGVNCANEGGIRIGGINVSSSSVKPPSNPSVSNTVTYEGVTYKTQTIGNQTWMIENLRVASPKGGSVCNSTFCPTYGALYTWAGAMALDSICNSRDCAAQISSKHKGICPSGWHIPSRTEWNMPGGREMYKTSILSGKYENSQFSTDIGKVGYWWTATTSAAITAYSWKMSYKPVVLPGDQGGTTVDEPISRKNIYYSVRCVKD
jgi:hypothetical protein